MNTSWFEVLSEMSILIYMSGIFAFVLSAINTMLPTSTFRMTAAEADAAGKRDIAAKRNFWLTGPLTGLGGLLGSAIIVSAIYWGLALLMWAISSPLRLPIIIVACILLVTAGISVSGYIDSRRK